MNISSWIQSRGRLLAILHDVFCIPIAWLCAFWLRFNLDGIPEEALNIAIKLFPTILVIQTGSYWCVGLYRGIWQFASIPDLMRILKAALFGCVASLVILFLVTRLQDFPRSVLPIYGMLLIIFLGGSRFFVRWIKDSPRWVGSGKRVLIIGAGSAGEGIVRDLLRNSNGEFKPVAFVDDRQNKQKQDIQGIRVVGQCEDIPRIVKEKDIQLIIIAVPNAKASNMRRILQYCEGTNCAIRTLPGLNDLVSGRVSIDLLREVSLEDLLGRDPVSLDWEAIQEAIKEKCVLVTGAGGSIGSELCRQIASLNPKELIVIERSEYNLFMLDQEFKEVYPQLKLKTYLLDICDRLGVQEILKKNGPDIIFHAAAYKHVPLLETHPREAVLNNILGTRCLAELALHCHIKKFVLVSSDKAVNPSNIMGASKRGSEMICHHFNAYGITQFITVRFGNVLGSAGSVVPIFKQQLEKGGPITVTHPDITRFFMTIKEACQLILQALSQGQMGEIFVLDMGEPIKIKFLAEQMIRLSGQKLGEDIQIHYTGLRSGEKLFEELFHPNEKLEATTHEKIYRASARQLDCHDILSILDAMQLACDQYNEVEIRSLLQQLVPELEIKDQDVSLISETKSAMPII